MKQKFPSFLFLSSLFFFYSSFLQASPLKQSFREKKGKTVTYHLTIDYKDVNFTGKARKAMSINDSLPAPTLYFKEGDMAVIHVTNKMDVESSIHWHGILLPNFQDGVPYLTTPPILPGKTYTYKFPLKHSGTYWYHSHTGLQEQRGLYGAIVVEPRKKRFRYNRDLVLVLSDWTDENPNEVMRTLKRGSEWYSVQKGTMQSFFDVVKYKVFIPQMKMWAMRMPGMDISDVYYPAFLINGQKEQSYPGVKAGERVRLRVINASASTYFWLSFGGSPPLLVSSDGVDVWPSPLKKRLLHAIAETYDFILTIPKGKSIEFVATAQDGSGGVRAQIGSGEVFKAPPAPKPHWTQYMKEMSHHSHKGGHSKEMMKKKMGDHSMKNHSHHKAPPSHKEKDSKNQVFSYEDLKSFQKFSKKDNTKEIHLKLTGNMWRYVWSMNQRVLSESDKIPIKKGEAVRLILQNQTMMHHPMHLHGHFFRVLGKKKNKDHPPFKHTVDVPPMETVTIEFDPDEKGDWFFHCHVLYHMMGGMTRIFSNESERDPRLKDYPAKKIILKDRHWFSWGEASLMSQGMDWELETSNTRNKILLEGQWSWFNSEYKRSMNFESELSYERFLTDFFRLYLGVEAEEKRGNPVLSAKDMDISSRMGLRWLLPFFVELDLSLDHKMRGEIELEYELMLFPRLEFFANWSLEVGTGLLKDGKEHTGWEQEWALGGEYMWLKNLSLKASYSQPYGWGAGLNLKY